VDEHKKRQNFQNRFPMKIIFYQCNFRYSPLLSINYDECRRTKKGRPSGGRVTKNSKILLARSASKEALRRGSIAEKTDFHGSGENIGVHACFSRA
jgi:hypothetical protein